MNNEVIFYSTPEGDKRVEIMYQGESFWLTQKGIAQLFNVKVPAVSKHLNNIFLSGELDRDSVVSILETIASDDKKNKKNLSLKDLCSEGLVVRNFRTTVADINVKTIAPCLIYQRSGFTCQVITQSYRDEEDWFFSMVLRLPSLCC